MTVMNGDATKRRDAEIARVFRENADAEFADQFDGNGEPLTLEARNKQFLIDNVTSHPSYEFEL